jgi:RNA polymerase sigma factor (TIGR02999 family)
MTAQPITELLVRWRQGDSEALQALVPLVYNELHDLAHRFLRRERSDHTLRSTALVHEAYLRFVHHGPIDTENRAHFVAIAARLMRQILVDYSRHHRAAKRGAGCTVVLEEAFVLARSKSADVIALDDALAVSPALMNSKAALLNFAFLAASPPKKPPKCSVSPQLRSNAIGVSPKPGCPDR